MNSQKSVSEQLDELIRLGNKAGLYDAVDYVKQVIEINRTPKWKMSDFEYKDGKFRNTISDNFAKAFNINGLDSKIKLDKT